MKESISMCRILEFAANRSGGSSKLKLKASLTDVRFLTAVRAGGL